MATGRSRKKNKFNERSSSSVRDKYSNDPAFIEDVRHLALRNTKQEAPDECMSKMFGSKKKSKSKEDSTHYSLRMERKKKQTAANNHSAEYLCRNTSSSESLENIISGQKGLSLDRSFENDAKPQMKPKRSSWFLRDKNREKQSSKNEKFFKRASLDFSLTFDTKQGIENNKPRAKAKTIIRQDAADYTAGDSSTTPQEEVPDPIKKLSKFQLGKRFLRGEIGIRSFNYYLVKEGLKKSVSKGGSTKSKNAPFMSKSEENIYEEIFFHDKIQKPQTPQMPPILPPPNKQQSQVNKLPDDGNCLKCEICLQEAAQEKHKLQNCDNCIESNRQKQQQQILLAEGYATVRKLDNATIYDFFQQHQQQSGNGILQFQSYNPNNPNVYKIETTPVATFSDYNLTIEEQLYQQHYAAIIALQQQQQQQHFSGDGKIMTKSSSSNDSIRQRQHENMANEFYTRPNYFYPSNSNAAEQNQSSSMRKDKNNSIYKTDSSNSLRSENSLNRNNSQKSNQMRQDMSDSSLGDSLFSTDPNKRYFGSSESCRFNYECDTRRGRRSSFEENEKCSFSDTCRNYETECNLRNCDCSSSYFSSDFDDTNVYSTANNVHVIKACHNESKMDATKSHYADDFIKHVNNVKRRSQNVLHDGGNNMLISTSIYEVPKANPKRIERTEHSEQQKLKKTGTVPKSSISSNESKKSTPASQRQKQQHPMSRNQLSNAETYNEVSKENLDNNLTLCEEATTMSNFEKKQLPLGTKIVGSSPPESDTVQKQKAQVGKTEQQSRKVVATDDNDDDEVFISHATTVSSTAMTTGEEKKTNEKPLVNTAMEKQPEIKINDGTKMPIENPTISSVKISSPRKSPSKAPKLNINEATKAQPAKNENNNKNITTFNDDKKKKEENNNDSSNDDDSVFLKTETTAEHKTSLKSNNGKASNAQASATQNPNISLDSNVKIETVGSKENQKSSKEKSLKHENDKEGKQNVKQQPSNEEQLDFNNIPLPDIPSKKSNNNKLNKGEGKSLIKDNPLPTSTAAKIQSKWKQLTEKEYFKKMHYRNSSFEKKPTYLFGENAKQPQNQQQQKDGIFLTRSGWLTTSSQRLEKEAEARKENINKLKKANSKIEELITRSEARRQLAATASGATPKDENVTILKIDPQSETRQILGNDRPVYLPVRTNLTRDGPPPPTPILSPPPGFQDHQIRNQIYEIKNGTRIQLSVTDDSDNKTTPTPKGMVFSRSFEYDNRKSAGFNENFSRSFDFDFQMRQQEKKQPINKNLLSRYGNSTPFATLTGISPNYLTKKETNEIVINPNASIFPKVIPGNKVKMNNAGYYNSVDEGRRQQFSRTGIQQTKFRNSLETGSTVINNRLNSCDSGARSDFSNDDLDEDDDDEDQSSSLALSYKSAAPTSYQQQQRNVNVTKTLVNQQQQQQQQTSFKKARSMTPDTSFDDYDLLTVDRNNTKRQRSLTPDKRPITPELIYKGSKLATSQTSLMSRQSSGSKNSTLERQLKRYEDGHSSSSTSDAENNNPTRRQNRPPFKTAFGDYRIRRSRSLQLSERSPNRSTMLQKLVVRIGNTAIPQSVASTPQAPATNQKYREKPDYVHTRSKTTLNMPTKYNAQLRNSDNSLPSSTQTKSFDMLDYNGKSNVDYEFESDSKSKSFDDDFCFNTKVTRNSGNGNARNNVFSGNRAFSQDRVLLVPPTNVIAASKSLRNSPRNYGSRLYDHDVIYDRNIMLRSPIMNYNRAPINPPLSRERSPVGGRKSRERDREYKKQQGVSNNFLKPRTTTTPNRSPNRSPSDSDDSINGNVNQVLKDKSLVSEYLFGLKRKQQANSMNRSSGTTSSGSCTSSSSCEFEKYWPHNKNNKNDSAGKMKKYPNKVCVNNDSDSSGNNVKISVNMQKQRQQAFRSGSVGTTIKVNGSVLTGNGALINKPNNSSIIFLGDCEMPITKSGSVPPEHNKSSGSDSSDRKFTQKIEIGGELKQQFAASSQQPRAQNYTRGKFFTPSFSSSCAGITIKRRQLFTRLQSRSLPRSFMRHRNLSSNTNELLSMFPPHSPLQMRAVSSPTLTENPLENQSSISPSPKFATKTEPNVNQNANSEINDRGHHQTVSSGVLQKFKKTFSHFKNGKTTVAVGDETNEAKHHRFGPLVWRTSKERRKTKTHRRDKCNSGDSGIQVELENDENLSENVHVQQMDISPKLNTSNAKVRRANSAKVSNVTVKTARNSNSLKQSAPAQRSLSQPSDLDVILCENKMMNNLDNIKHIDDDDASDTDSLSSNHVDEIEPHQQGVVYAEVLYRFDAGGPQELSLEKGTLIEVIKRESGPWWWGRIKYDAVINDNEIEMHQGWFPKDFVKVIPTYGANRKIIHQQASESNDCDIMHPPTSSAPTTNTISSSHSSSEIMKDNVIKELLETEINYVKLLNSLVNGFMKEMKERPEVFSPDSLSLMFSNIEQIYRFQQNFLEALRIAIPKGKIADVFLDFQSAFMCYSQYCNSYPRTLMELENFNGNAEAASILESCRIAQNLPELPLSAHLLAPIQRICRYPLHLSELVKHSKTRKEILLKLDVHQLSKPNLETSDFKEMYEVALNAMKRVTEMVNEGKRHSEYLSRMQARLENFQGPSINIHSSRLFLQTDAIRVSPNLWNNTYTLFLFDRQLIYCKKDLLKRTSYIYKGRIFLDNCRILNLPDGRMFGVNLKNALRIFCETRGKWFDFCFRSSSSKTRFLNTLSAERQFCGSSLFVSEIASGLEDDNLSDDGNTQEYDERGIDVDSSPQLQTLLGNVASQSLESPMKQQKFSDSLPKKSRKLSKEVPSQIIIDYNPSATTSSANRRRLGNWFRKSKSTNSTPSQSPTHHPLVSTATVPSIVNHSDSQSSSQQSSPTNYPRQKFKEGSSNSVGGST